MVCIHVHMQRSRDLIVDGVMCQQDCFLSGARIFNHRSQDNAYQRQPTRPAD